MYVPLEQFFFSKLTYMLSSQVDDSTLDDADETVDLPDSLLQFRSNLVEVLVDICQLLKSAPFIQKVINLGHHALFKLVSGLGSIFQRICLLILDNLTLSSLCISKRVILMLIQYIFLLRFFFLNDKSYWSSHFKYSRH